MLTYTKQGNGERERKEEWKGPDTAPGITGEFRAGRRCCELWGPGGQHCKQQASDFAGCDPEGCSGRCISRDSASAPRKGHSREVLSPSGRTRPQVAGQLGPWKVLQSPFGTFHIQVLPSAVPANRTGARGCHSIHSRSPASKDQTSSLVSTCHTFKRPLMSPVATRVESWLKPAQVTESLWPSKKSGQKQRKKIGYLVLGACDSGIWPPERTS